MSRIFARHLPAIAIRILLAGTAIPAAALAQTATDQAPAERNKAIVAGAFDRWAAGGSNFFNEVLSPDVVWTIEGSGPSAATYRSRGDLVEGAVRPLADRLSTPIRPVSKQIWAEGDHVIINWEGAAVARDGKPYSNSYVWIFRMEEGRAAEVTAFLDLAAYDDVLRRIPRSDVR